ncbi:O-phosphoseryl-tRNA(Sec) selenium transferase [Tetrabaena socialis]|uniref:O-phosphoseryl-tRNA(Sec) selenium transferase n=1 Tax=Tetrabaena socialis TaxID=47790 RepID=A0A2J8AKB6_9CHLO|nr:O-phosphoseryl-tRNA(Sec) selenium transferase [Tetrabaena socialis]|eukprot:PNH12953.1 O-phosphoseryl-tRNA(Sec) selenium transferase [Tetrabaena socialis]
MVAMAGARRYSQALGRPPPNPTFALADELFQASTSQLSFEKFISTINQEQAKDLVRSINQFMKDIRKRAPDSDAGSREVQEFLTSMEQSFARHPLWAGSSRKVDCQTVQDSARDDHRAGARGLAMNADNCSLAIGLVSKSYIRQGEQALARRQRLIKALLSSRKLPERGWDEATIEMLIRALSDAIAQIGPDRIAAVVTTTSCFAPRAPDDIVAVACLCAATGLPHVINNAYGVQSRAICASICSAWNKGRVDAVVQSTDKNFMVPVGGAVAAAPASRPDLVAAVNSTYPGRASISPVLDLMMTLLHWGAEGWRQALVQCEEVVPYLRARLQEVAARHGEWLLATPANPISVALTLDTLASASAAARAEAVSEATKATSSRAEAAKADDSAPEIGGGVAVSTGEGVGPDTACEASNGTRRGGSLDGATVGSRAGAAGAGGSHTGPKPAHQPPDVTFFGSMLWSRCVSGTRVVAPGKAQTVGGVPFRNYGSHTDIPYPSTYMTAAAALGTTRADVDELVVRLDRCFAEFRKKVGGRKSGS